MIISGSLVDAVGQVIADTQIRVTPTINSSVSKESVAYVTVPSNGTYTFSLGQGRYLIEVKYTNPNNECEEFNLLGEVDVPSSSSTVTLAQLMSTYEYTPPAETPEFPERQPVEV